MNIFQRIIQRSIYIPFQEVGCATEDFLRVNSRISIYKKYLSRYLRLLFWLQSWREVNCIPKNARVLWLHTGKRNIGDALMEASGRSLLKDHTVFIDLLTLPNLAPVFDGDDVFKNVYYDISEINCHKYDYVLMTEFNHRTIKTKGRYFNRLPYACMFGYFYGPDRNQTLFSFCGINKIFNLKLSSTFLVNEAKPYMCRNDNVESVVKLKSPFVVIAVGGIDANRTYRNWPAVLKLIDESELHSLFSHVVLLGSENGRQDAESLMNLRFPNLTLLSYVGLLSLQESQTVIAQSLRFLGCDGGLMHVAHTTSTPTVTVFANEPSDLRLTRSCHSLPLQGRRDVNDIAPEQIVSALKESLNTSFERN